MSVDEPFTSMLRLSFIRTIVRLVSLKVFPTCIMRGEGAYKSINGRSGVFSRDGES